jgi:hypothetical protein
MNKRKLHRLSTLDSRLCHADRKSLIKRNSNMVAKTGTQD